MEIFHFVCHKYVLAVRQAPPSGSIDLYFETRSQVKVVIYYRRQPIVAANQYAEACCAYNNLSKIHAGYSLFLDGRNQL